MSAPGYRENAPPPPEPAPPVPPATFDQLLGGTLGSAVVMSIAGAVACGLAGGDDETMASGGVFGFIIPVTIGAVIVLGPKWWGVMRIIWRARGRLETDQESRERGRAKAARQDGGDP